MLNLFWFVKRHEVRGVSQSFPFNYFKMLKLVELFKLFYLKCTNSRFGIDNRTPLSLFCMCLWYKSITLYWCRTLKVGEDLILVLPTKWTLTLKCLLPLKEPSLYWSNHSTFLSFYLSLFFLYSCLCIWFLHVSDYFVVKLECRKAETSNNLFCTRVFRKW
jgi:hypothetical protein